MYTEKCGFFGLLNKCKWGLLTSFDNSKPIYVSTCRFLAVRNDADVRLEQPFRRQFIHFYLKRAN
jgi:hypothetical protein